MPIKSGSTLVPLRGSDGQWFALSLRDRVLYARKELACKQSSWPEVKGPGCAR